MNDIQAHENLTDALRSVQAALQPMTEGESPSGEIADAVRLVDAADTIVNRILHNAVVARRPLGDLQKAQLQLAHARRALGDLLEPATEKQQ